jgi:nucleoside-diphosphate-sugar epimerase
LRDAHGRPLKRNFVHVDDLVDAILAALDNPATRSKLYNIAMDEPVDTAAVAAHLKATQGLGSIDVPSSTSTGARATISPSSSTPPGPTSASPTIHARSGIPADGRRNKR